VGSAQPAIAGGAEAAKDSAWSRTCTIADSAPLTLQFVFDDYVDHMLQHLRHIGLKWTFGVGECAKK